MRRVPVAVWVVLGVVAAHLLFFWVVADKHFLPKTRYIAPAPTPNFGARRSTSVDPQTGEVTTHEEFVVSTRLVKPPPAAEDSRSKDQNPSKIQDSRSKEAGRGSQGVATPDARR